MAWEENQLTRTLLIQRDGLPPRATYRLHPYMRVTDCNGASYLEPLPSGGISLAHMGYIFKTVEFIEPPASNMDGDIYLTRDGMNGSLTFGADARD